MCQITPSSTNYLLEIIFFIHVAHSQFFFSFSFMDQKSSTSKIGCMVFFSFIQLVFIRSFFPPLIFFYSQNFIIRRVKTLARSLVFFKIDFIRQNTFLNTRTWKEGRRKEDIWGMVVNRNAFSADTCLNSIFTKKYEYINTFRNKNGTISYI